MNAEIVKNKAATAEVIPETSATYSKIIAVYLICGICSMFSAIGTTIYQPAAMTSDTSNPIINAGIFAVYLYLSHHIRKG